MKGHGEKYKKSGEIKLLKDKIADAEILVSIALEQIGANKHKTTSIQDYNVEVCKLGDLQTKLYYLQKENSVRQYIDEVSIGK